MSQPGNLTTWHVFRINDYTWWVATSLHEAITCFLNQSDTDDPLAHLDNPRPVSKEDMEHLQFYDDHHDPMAFDQWIDEEGNPADSNCRWNGFQYEKPAGHPIGHIPLTCITKRSFQQELENMITEGIKTPQLFATTEH